jgi:hypothetical protein
MGMPPRQRQPQHHGPDHVLEPDGVRHQRRDDHHDEGPLRQERAGGGALVGDIPPRGPRHQPHEQHERHQDLRRERRRAVGVLDQVRGGEARAEEPGGDVRDERCAPGPCSAGPGRTARRR